MRRPATRLLALATAAVSVAAGLSAQASERPASPGLRSVMYVGNNWAGTVNLVDSRTFEVLRSGIDLIPDRAEELARIRSNPADLALYLAIQQGPGEGHDQYVDDMFSTRDGKLLAVSRPSFGDVVWIDIAKAIRRDPTMIVREQSMDGFRTDHMGLSPDGRRLLVSDSTERQVIEYSMVSEMLPSGRELRVGDRLRAFESGETPHESNYSKDGSRVFHASIGRVYTPGDTVTAGPVKIGPAHDALKGDRWFQTVRTRDMKVLERWDMAAELAESGYPGMQSAVRPMAIGPGERFLYFQVSYFHGVVEFDAQARDRNSTVDYTLGGVAEPRTGAVTRILPLRNDVPTMPLDQYVNDSGHHGLAIDSTGRTLCVAGTMDDYAALVDVRTGHARYYDEKTTGHYYGKPYWAVEGPGDTCWLSLSDADAVAVLDVKTGRELAYFGVGDHPQRVRLGVVPRALVAGRR